mmetsp:Transcript_7146/g.30452  ORF Transcript_7146/g.30452 Transcript_7146/m.30452 type:complete len:241 (-) Transcript_7146:135-857(-)
MSFGRPERRVSSLPEFWARRARFDFARRARRGARPGHRLRRWRRRVLVRRRAGRRRAGEGTHGLLQDRAEGRGVFRGTDGAAVLHRVPARRRRRDESRLGPGTVLVRPRDRPVAPAPVRRDAQAGRLGPGELADALPEAPGRRRARHRGGVSVHEAPDVLRTHLRRVRRGARHRVPGSNPAGGGSRGAAVLQVREGGGLPRAEARRGVRRVPEEGAEAGAQRRRHRRAVRSRLRQASGRG